MNPGASTISMCRARHRGAGSLSLPEACEVAHSRHRNLSPSFLHRSPLEAPTPHVRSRARSLMTGQFQSSPYPGRIARSPFGVPPIHIEAERSSDFRTPPTESIRLPFHSRSPKTRSYWLSGELYGVFGSLSSGGEAPKVFPPPLSSLL